MNENSINEKVMHAKNNDDLFTELVNDEKKFILASAYQVTGTYVNESDDVYEIALLAFYEAVNTFDETKGQFYSFAQLVIRRRLIDYLKSENKFKEAVSVSFEALSGDVDEYSDEKQIAHSIKRKEFQIANEVETENKRREDIKDEIERMQLVLKTYGFSFYDLTSNSPKAEKTKLACGRIVVSLLEDEELFNYMSINKTLPIKQLCEKTDIPRKIVERHRKYIIAASEIMKGDYPQLKEYMSYIRKMIWENS